MYLQLKSSPRKLERRSDEALGHAAHSTSNEVRFQRFRFGHITKHVAVGAKRYGVHHSHPTQRKRYPFVQPRYLSTKKKKSQSLETK
jgi:hypothetical protein